MSNISEIITIESSIEHLLSEQLREVLLCPSTVFVTGQPLHIFSDKGAEADLSFNECPEIIDHPVMVSRIFRQRVPLVGHRHLEPHFIDPDGYPAVQCFAFNGDEIIMGIRRQLGFSIRKSDPSKTISI